MESNSEKSWGTIVEFKGKVELLEAHSSKIRAVTGTENFRAFDRIQTSADSTATLQSAYGQRFLLGSRTLVRVEFWEPSSERSPLLVHVLRGGIGEVSPAPEAGAPALYFVTQGRLSTVAQDSGLQIPVISERKSKIADEKISSLRQDIRKTFPSEDMIPESAESKATLTSATPNSEIFSQKIWEQKSAFQKCQRDHLSADRTLKLQALITVAPSGIISEVHIAANKASTEKFNGCVSAVFKKITFKQFAGEPVRLNQSLAFE